ncbi:hypothetical protein UPYG_G00331890 [Umbra pygmaea]|uniref:XK-related protein n=1 Tax=Umbra pygmaea TaxID=75934 RepID=A0ABD0VXA6_UMBPY
MENNVYLEDREWKSGCMSVLSYLLNLVLYLLDVAIDVWAVWSLYRQESYVFMGVLLFILLGSSLLVNSFSFLWLFYDNNEAGTWKKSHVKILHVFQMGVFFRYAGVVSISICSFCCKKRYTEDNVRYLTNDLSLLRLIETFSESAPQLVLMLTHIIQRGDMELFTIMKALVSWLIIAVSVTMYHRSLCSFHPDKAKQGWFSSITYFLWNLLLIGPRVTAVALFTSVFPCYIAVHFLSYWMVLFFFAFRCKTKFMDSAGGEWLYRATVGLIWYFSWLSVVEHTRMLRTFYHIWIGVDIVILCGLWVWQMKINPPYFDLPLDPYVVFGVMMSLYLAGLGLMGVYYKYCHPNVIQQRNTLVTTNVISIQKTNALGHNRLCLMKQLDISSGPPIRVNKRMETLANNFYSLRTSSEADVFPTCSPPGLERSGSHDVRSPRS